MDRDDFTSSSSKTNRGKRSGRRAVTGDELALWQRATRDVPRLQMRRDAPPAEAPNAPPPAVAEATGPAKASRGTPRRPPPSAAAIATGLATTEAPGLDQRTRKRLQRGQIPPEARIDLHFCTQEQAFRELQRFLAGAQAAGRRCVLVITGKGYGGGGAIGVLKSGVPRWLEEEPNRSRVLAHCAATPPFGGEGALFVLLRRAKR